MQIQKEQYENHGYNIGIFSKLAECILIDGAYKATKYFSENSIVRATRKRYKGKILKNHIDIVFTMGKPNYEEREHIKKVKKAGGTFPINKILVKMPKESK
jgi:hypothetical protein